MGTATTQIIISGKDELSSVVATAGQRLGTELQAMQRQVLSLDAAIAGLVGYFAGGAISTGVKDAAMLTARYETLGVVMNVVGNNAGYTSAEMQRFEDQLRQTGITALESRNNLAAMASANIDLTKASELARMAQNAAVLGNINSSDAFNRMIKGIQAASVVTLRTIGINVNFEASYKKIAAQLDKNTEDLTENEKIQARLNAVLAQAPSIAGVYEESLTTVGKKMSSLSRYSEDARVKLGAVFQPALVLLVDTYTDALKGVNAQLDNTSVIEKWARVIKSEVLDIMQMGAALNMVLVKAGQAASIVGMGVYGPGSALGIENSRKGFEYFAGAYLDHQKQFADSEAYLNKLINEQARLADTVREQTTEHLAEQARIAAGNARRAEEAALELMTGKGKSTKASESALAKMQSEIAKLTMSAADFEHYKVDQEFAKIAAEIGAAHPLLQKWVALRREEAELVRTKSVGQELTNYFETIDKQYAATVANAERAKEENERILLDFADRHREVVLGETDFKKEQIDRQAQIFRAAGAEEIAVAQWVAQEKLAISRDWQDGATRALRSYVDEATNAAAGVEEVMGMAFTGMEDMIVEFVKTGKFQFADLVTSINAEIARLAYRDLAAQSYDWLGGLMKTGLSLAGSYYSGGASVAAGSAGGGFNYAGELSSFFSRNALGGVYDSPSLSAYSGGVYNTPQFFAFAKGAGVFGEAGPEAIMPLKRGTDGSLGVRVAGGDDETKALLREISAGIKAQKAQKNVFAFDKRTVANELSGSEGEQMTLTHVRRNPGAFRRILGLS